MADPNQYLRLQLRETSYLLPSTAGFTIEQRENLTVNKSLEGNIAAWQPARAARLPAYCLDGMLRATRYPDWHRAVFLDAAPHAVGLVVDEVQLLPRSETAITPFVPLGQPATRMGHLFSGAWVTASRIVLVFDHKVLVAYLQSLGEAP